MTSSTTFTRVNVYFGDESEGVENVGAANLALLKRTAMSAYNSSMLPPEEVGHEGAAETGLNSSSDVNAGHPGEGEEHEQETVDLSVATLSSPWQYDEVQPHCASCQAAFTPLNRRHHCRLCGKIFCHDCSRQKALIPPSSIVLVPKGGKKAKPRSASSAEDAVISFSPDPDPDRMLTYLSGGEENELLYGKGLEERFKLAREPLRVCKNCHQRLLPLQEELRNSNSNAMRFNHIDPTDPRRLFNSPLAFTLGHEIRKAAYTLNNLLPLPKRMGALMTIPESRTDSNSPYNFDWSAPPNELQQCKEQCSAVSPNLGDLDGVRIPARLMEEAKGVAVMTVCKGGFGLAGVEFGTGLVVARLDGNRWSAPSAIGTAGLSWGALLGAQVSDHVFVLMTDAAVEMMFSDSGSVQLGADVGVALGPLGRSLEADVGAAPGSVAPVYTYSLSKGLYAGISLDGKVIVTRHNVNEKFYGQAVSAREILHGAVPSPPAAQPLYEALARCRVYTTGLTSQSRSTPQFWQQQQPPQSFPSPQQPMMLSTDPTAPTGAAPSGLTYPIQSMPPPTMPLAYPTNPDTAVMGEYGEVLDDFAGQPPDHHSVAAMSDLTTDPGY